MQASYSHWEVFWYVGGFVVWAPAYAVIIVRAARRRELEIPIIAAIGNITWEFVWGFVYYPDMGSGLRLVYQLAFFMDAFILVGTFRFGAQQVVVPLVRRWYAGVLIALIAGWILFHTTLEETGYELPLGSVSAYLVNMVESSLYLWAGLTRPDHRTLSRIVAWSKGVGTGMVTVFVFIRYPDNEFIRAIAGMVGLLDLAYIVLLEVRYRRPDAIFVGDAAAGTPATAGPAAAATVATTPTRWTDAVLDPMRLVGDPIADEPVAAVLEAGGADAVNALMRTLVSTDQPNPAALPDPIREYLDGTDDLPEWADLDRIHRAEHFFEVFGPQIITCLFCASLPSAYAAVNGVQALALTARLQTDTRRRIVETGQFLMDVLEPGGLEHGHGLRSIQRVRLMHGAVRHLIETAAFDDPTIWRKEWGVPINQEELAGTMLSFSYVVGEPMPRLGINVDDRDAEDFIHTWNVIGSLLGIRDELLVRDLTDAGELVAAIRLRNFAPSPEGVAMTAALLDLLDEMSPLSQLDRFIPTLVRHLIGDETADLIDVPQGARRPWRFTGALLELGGLVESELTHHEVLQRIIEPVSKELLAAGFALERGGERAPFAIPTSLAAQWYPQPAERRTSHA